MKAWVRLIVEEVSHIEKLKQTRLAVAARGQVNGVFGTR